MSLEIYVSSRSSVSLLSKIKWTCTSLYLKEDVLIGLWEAGKIF